jgi:hypothetical protein
MARDLRTGTVVHALASPKLPKKKARYPGDGKFPPVPYDGGGKPPKVVGKPKNRSFQATNDLNYRRYA